MKNVIETPNYDNLKPQYQKFVDAYLTTNFHGTRSAIIAGYKEKSASVQATRLLKKDNIKLAIKERLNTISLQVEEILLRYSNTARFDISNYVITEKIDNEVFRALDIEKLINDGYGHMLKGVTYDKYGRPIYEFKSSEHALDQLAKIHDLFKSSSSNNLDLTIKVVSEEDYNAI